LDKCAEDLAFFDKRIQNGIIETLTGVVNSKFAHMTYTDALRELEKKPDAFEFKPYWGCDLQSEHEKYLTEKVVEARWRSRIIPRRSNPSICA
jgi:asparaginyl-tRNA synthetase